MIHSQKRKLLLRRAMSLFVWVSILVFSSIASAQTKARNWSATFDGGWQAALSLQPPDQKGFKRGNYFWLTNERNVLWSEDERTITVIFQNPWNELSADSPKVIYLKEADGIRISKEGLSPAEMKALSDVLWKVGGKTPGDLGSFYDRHSPYSRSHDRGDFILDMNAVSMPLARHALRAFLDDDRLLIPWIAHKEFTNEAFQFLMAETKRPMKMRDAEGERRIHAIQLQIAKNPVAPREVLDELWRQPIARVWGGGGLRLEVARHTKADPGWYQELYKLLDSDDSEAKKLRGSLCSYPNLPADLIDLLIRRIDQNYHAENLASRTDLLPRHIDALIEKHPWDVYGRMIIKGTLPENRYKDAIDLGSQDIMQEIMWSKKAPESAVLLVLEKRITNPEFYNRHSARDALLEAVSDPRLPERLHKLHIAHPVPEIRAGLAKNPSLSPELLRVLATDPFAVVARAAREQLAKTNDEQTSAFLASLPPLESLNQSASMREEIKAALQADDPERFERMRKMFEETPGYSTSQGAVKAQAIACLRDQINRKNWTRKSLASYAGGEGWTPAMTDLVLAPPVEPETISAFAVALSQRGKAEDFQVLLDRGHDLRATTEPIAWHAVARRDRDMLEKIAKLGAPLDLHHEGMTPAQLAARIRFLGALDLLPMDENAKRELAAFREKFPGDEKAPWLGDWTNGKGEFKTLVLRFNPDGSGALITATGVGVMTAWRRDPQVANRMEIHAFDDNGNQEAQTLKADWKKEQIELKLPDRVETFKRTEILKK